MKKISQDAAAALHSRKPFKRDNTRVYIDDMNACCLELFGNLIATYHDTEILFISNGGFPSRTTCDRLNAVMYQFGKAYRINAKGLIVDWRDAEKDAVQVDFDGFIDVSDIPSLMEKARADKEQARADKEAEQQAERERKKQIAIRRLKGIDADRQTAITAEFAKATDIDASILRVLLGMYKFDLRVLSGQPPEALCGKVLGIGMPEAERITSVFDFARTVATAHVKRNKVTAPADIADLMMPKMRYLEHEVVACLALDTKGGVKAEGVSENAPASILEESVIFEGTLNASVFHPREIFRFAIHHAANSIILVHNHPSGCPKPSQEDIRATKQLIEAGNQIGIKVLDHVIIGDGDFVSLKEENLI